VAGRKIRGSDRAASSLALATSAGCLAFLVVNALFDTMSFPQAPYIFFIVAALSTIAASGPQGNCEPAPGVLWRRRVIEAARAGSKDLVPVRTKSRASFLERYE
jgi:hypothetical protein